MKKNKFKENIEEIQRNLENKTKRKKRREKNTPKENFFQV